MCVPVHVHGCALWGHVLVCASANLNTSRKGSNVVAKAAVVVAAAVAVVAATSGVKLAESSSSNSNTACQEAPP